MKKMSLKQRLAQIAQAQRTGRKAMLSMLLVTTTLAAGVALAAAPRTAVAAEDLSQHIVKPSDAAYGTTIDLFDYWVAGEGLYDGGNDESLLNEGINNFGKFYNSWNPMPGNPDEGYHQLIFMRDIGQMSLRNAANPWSSMVNFNKWPGPNGLTQGMVETKLDNGYPVLASSGSTQTKLPVYRESLRYLFDPTMPDVRGRRAYSNVKGLLDVDKDGYYYYNCTQNFAEYDADSKSFKLYDSPGVKPGHSTGDSQIGQFFPFNTGAQVFGDNPTLDRDGKLDASRFTNEDDAANHYFGLSMSTRFQQPENGQVTVAGGTKIDMTYKFSGDDDVWVYIDDVLVGDLGGTHNQATLNINFRTGDITTTCGKTVINSNLKNQFQSAKANTDDFNENDKTFKDGTYHTLKFFYLERGNYASNMQLKFNLLTVPTSDVIKVDQNGTVLPGVEFALYQNTAAEGKVGYTENDLLAKGTTDSQGKLVLENSEHQPISFDELAADKKTRYVLVEKNVPAGYSQLVNVIPLKYVEDPNGNPSLKRGGLVQDPSYKDPNSSVWSTGSLAMPKEIVSLDSTFEDNKGEKYNYDALGENGGTVFAVVYQKGTDKQWYPILGGNQLDGWDVSPTPVTNVNQIRGIYDKMVEEGLTFTLKASGAYECSIEDLPGTIEDYDYWQDPNLSDAERQEKAQYAVGFYLKKADDTIVLLKDESFAHSFSVKIYVSNIKNEVYVQKLDEGGNALPGATFGLYESENGKEPDWNTSQPIGKVTTADLKQETDGLELNGGAVFGMPKPEKSQHPEAFSDVAITTGVYYIKEILSPDPNTYEVNPTAIKVIVDDNGIYVDAGTTDDGVSVIRGAGKLVKTLTQFARGNRGTDNPKWSLNDTLRWIKSQPGQVTVDENNKVQFGAWTGLGGATLEIGTAENGVFKLNPATEDPWLHMEYDAGPGLEFGARDEKSSTVFRANAGWLVIRSFQDDREDGQTAPLRTKLTTPEDLTNPNGKSLSSVVTGSALVQVTDKFVPAATHDLRIYKKDASGAALEGATFKVTSENQKFNQECEVKKGEPEDGKEVAYATFTGLTNGVTYTIEETKVPAGFQKLTEKLTLTIDKDGKATLYKAEGSAFGEVLTDANGNYKIEVTNTKLADLPQTGGMGNTVLYVAGVALVSAAAAYGMWRVRELRR